MANTLTQAQVEAALKPYGFTGSATGGAAQKFLASNPAAAKAFEAYSASGGKTAMSKPTAVAQPTPAPTPQPGNSLTQRQVEDFLRPYGFSGSASGGAAQAFLSSNPQAATAFRQFSASGGAAGTPQPVTTVMSDKINNPELPALGTANYTPLQVNKNELMTGQGSQVAGTQVQTPAAIAVPQLGQAAQATATQVDQNNIIQFLNPETGQYEALTIGPNVPQATAQQGIVNDKATIQGQLTELYAESTPGQIPDWAKGAVKNANEALSARGLGSSTIGPAAIAAAIQQSALPIAAADAATYFSMDMANLTNRQQTELTNVQLKQQALLTDQAATNAASQFNATSSTQTQQFMASLVSQIQTQNADRVSTISQFNTNQKNSFAQAQAALDDGVNKFNTQMKTQIDSFNANLETQRQQFNATNAFAIEQSNVLWRRAANTGNTAGYNAANQANVQNAYNMSATALNNLWQQYRDESAWLFSASEAQKDRNFQLAYLANQQSFAEDQSGNDLSAAVGSFAAGLLIK
jgi:hypothetical protein